MSEAVRVSATPLSMAGVGSRLASWEPNWIDYRSSVANVDRRRDRDDVVAVCTECGCELDITPEPHSPKCPTLVQVTVEDGRQLLDRMDAGEPLTGRSEDEPEDEEAEPEDEQEPELEETPEPDGEAGSGVSSSSNGRMKWPREKVVAAIREVGEKVGRTPSGADMRAHGLGGAYQVSIFKRLDTTWQDLVSEAGYEPRRRGDNGKGSGREPKAEAVAAVGTASERTDVLTPPAALGGGVSRPDDEHPEPAMPPPDLVEPATLALVNIADLTVNAGAWIEALRGESDRLDRRSEALRMIATGLAELEETAP